MFAQATSHPRAPRRLAAVGLLVWATLVAACGSSTDSVSSSAADQNSADQNSAEQNSADEANTVATAETGEGGEAAQPTLAGPPSAALSWAGKDLDGNPVSGGDFAGKDVVLWFWAPWCPVCNEEAPGVAALARTYGDQVTFVGIAAHDKVEPMRKFVAKYELPFVQVNDEKASIWAKLGIPGQPSAYFIEGTTGEAIGPVIGVTAEGMEVQIRALLN